MWKKHLLINSKCTLFKTLDVPEPLVHPGDGYPDVVVVGSVVARPSDWQRSRLLVWWLADGDDEVVGGVVELLGDCVR